jgi:uncharacterized protein YbcV (DUF1398 family)
MLHHQIAHYFIFVYQDFLHIYQQDKTIFDHSMEQVVQAHSNDDSKVLRSTLFI